MVIKSNFNIFFRKFNQYYVLNHWITVLYIFSQSIWNSKFNYALIHLILFNFITQLQTQCQMIALLRLKWRWTEHKYSFCTMSFGECRSEMMITCVGFRIMGSKIHIETVEQVSIQLHSRKSVSLVMTECTNENFGQSVSSLHGR